MTAVAERAVNGEFACLRSKDFQDFANHDRPMRAGGSLAAGDHLCDVSGITVRRVLFILLRKMSRILSFVSRPALGSFRTHVIQSAFPNRDIYITYFEGRFLLGSNPKNSRRFALSAFCRPYGAGHPHYSSQG